MDKTEIINKINSAVADMNDKTEFINNKTHKHVYRVKATDEWLQGVSSVSSIVPKDWLSAWGGKEASKFLGYSDYVGDTERAIEMKNKIAEMSLEDYIKLLGEAKGAAFRKSKEAMVDGKAGHALLEAIVKARIDGKEIPAIPSGTLERPITQWLDWEKENVDYWILSEGMVCYPEYKYGGTLDALAMMKNGKLALVDFKFASHISEDYYLQTAAYAFTFEPYGIKVDERIIIRLPKTLEREEYDPKNHKYFKVPNNLEVEWVKTNYDEDKMVFINALPVKKWCNQFVNKFK